MARDPYDRKDSLSGILSTGPVGSEGEDDAVVRFLRECSIHDFGHIHGDLLEHLVGTCALLRDWGNPLSLCQAGLCHAVYSTDGYALKLLDVTSERGKHADLIGREAEALVYFYASCDRAHVYPQLGVSPAVQFRDRFTGSIFTPPSPTLAAFLELTFANELDIIAKDPRLVAPAEPVLGAMFRRCEGLVSAPAFSYFLKLFGERDGSQQ